MHIEKNADRKHIKMVMVMVITSLKCYNLFLLDSVFFYFQIFQINITYNQKKMINAKFARQIILYPTLEQESRGGKCGA